MATASKTKTQTMFALVDQWTASDPDQGRLPVEEVHIHPECDLSNMVCIGANVTDELEIQPAQLYIKRYFPQIRPGWRRSAMHRRSSRPRD